MLEFLQEAQWLFYSLTGFASGIVSGMGIGGGAILIPALDIFFDLSQQEAQSINLLYFIPTASIAIITHKKKGNIESKGLWKLIVFGLVGAAAGSLLALWLDSGILRRIFGGFLLLMGVYEIYKGWKFSRGRRPRRPATYHKTTGRRGRRPLQTKGK